MNKLINTQLADQLLKTIEEGKVKLRYPDGYKAWKKKFDYFYNLTKSVSQTLNIIYGPQGGVTDYRGSIYSNANIPIKEVLKKPEQNKGHHKSRYKRKPFKKSGSLQYLFIKRPK